MFLNLVIISNHKKSDQRHVGIVKVKNNYNFFIKEITLYCLESLFELL